MSCITNCSDTQKPLVLWCEDHPEGVILWTCFTMVCFVFGFPAAVAVLWDMIQRGRKGAGFTPYDVFVLNSTVIDGMYLLFSVTELYNYLHEFDVDYELFMIFVFPFDLCGRPLFTTCICVDCYLAVVHPVVYHANKSLTPRVLTAVAVWTLTLICGAIFAKFWSHAIDGLVQVLVFALTLPIIGFCDVCIFWTLKRSNPAGGSVHPKKKKALQVIINNLVLTFTSFLPPVIGVLMSKFLNMDGVSTYCHVMFPVLCSMLVGNSVSPILYLNNLGKIDWLRCLRQK